MGAVCAVSQWLVIYLFGRCPMKTNGETSCYIAECICGKLMYMAMTLYFVTGYRENVIIIDII
jgi:hypothetical protein